MLSAKEKYKALKEYLKSLKSVAVAFSGGVDSTLLLMAAKEALGDKLIAVTARASSFPEREHNEAEEFCRRMGIRQVVVDFNEFSVEGFSSNPPDRCYFCKKALFTGFKRTAQEHGMAEVCEGSNMDDMGDYRPGMKAVAELGIKSPLRAAELTKAEIRDLLHEKNIPVWSKPSFACLASRFVYGETITKEKLNMVGRAEQLLLDMGFTQVRVRIHGMMARIEVLPEDILKIAEENTRRVIVDKLKSYGFMYISLDLAGYRTGSMNAQIGK